MTDAGVDVLKQRGNLSPEEIMRAGPQGQEGRLSFSDNVQDADEAKLVQLNTLKAHGVTVNETGL